MRALIIVLGVTIGYGQAFLGSLPAKAEGGCPNGFFPIGGGYCRNIVCNFYTGCGLSEAKDAIQNLKQYGTSCGLSCTQWGDQTIPMR
jgi:hypothetical protein